MSQATLIRLVILAVLVVIVLIAIRLHGAAAQERRGDPQSGRLFAEALCTECHAVSRESAGVGRYAPDFVAIAGRRSTTAQSLRRAFRGSHGGMPQFEFGPREAEDIIAYMLSLRPRATRMPR